MVARMPRRRSSVRVVRAEYALSATTCSGRVRGRPTPPAGTRIAASSPGSCGLSPACPGVSSTASGRPRPSTARWSLLLSPPRDRPRASPGTGSTRVGAPLPLRPPPFSRPRGVLVGADHGGVDRDDPLHRLPVGVDLQIGEDPLPGTVRGPPPMPLVQRLPRAVPLRNVPPRRPRGQLPHDPVDHLPVIPPPPATPARRWQQRRDPRPRLIGQLMPSNHQTREQHPTRSAGQALGLRPRWFPVRSAGGGPSGREGPALTTT